MVAVAKAHLQDGRSEGLVLDAVVEFLRPVGHAALKNVDELDSRLLKELLCTSTLSFHATIDHGRAPIVQRLALDQHDGIARADLIVAHGEALALHAAIALGVQGHDNDVLAWIAVCDDGRIGCHVMDGCGEGKGGVCWSLCLFLAAF